MGGRFGRVTQTALLVVALGVSSAAWAQQSREEQIRQQAMALDWKAPGSYTLADSQSTVTVPAASSALIGPDGETLMRLSGDEPPETFEAIVLDDQEPDQVILEYFDVGYVALDDWGDLDASGMLEGIKESTEEANVERARQNSGQLHVLRWLREPTLVRSTNTVTWAIEASVIEADGSSAGNIVNAISIHLGRNGFEKLTWVTDASRYTATGGYLQTIINGFSFTGGNRYVDYRPGDPTAGFGVAALVGTIAGAKLLQAGFFAAALIFLKKFGVFVVAAVGGVLWRVFRRGNAPAAPPPTAPPAA